MKIKQRDRGGGKTCCNAKERKRDVRASYPTFRKKKDTAEKDISNQKPEEGRGVINI